ncbi:putative leucine rich repeat protein [Leptomonas pyrrhocoris]|uniref:Putative leucine rich repeat protein n=1 Tax=Leptomonas pyrrhocoris TaxID=157538 RepID=A0A0M9G4P4_LEPPY|nr:putative leucine rich repeat protein [Leptomonas pyrrhocoris]KPA82059.1 putative leucine rich repeat protein [Leptomonas pyrrhocoris]|eukprot:XP_015660498.1 putative leucine rich repeat protein [Leptomonas pyrrhocoris]
MSDSLGVRENFGEQQQPMQINRSVFEAMQSQMHMLQMRVETLEQQVAMLSAQAVAASRSFQPYPKMPYGMAPASATAATASPTAGMPPTLPSNVYFYPQGNVVNAGPEKGNMSRQLEAELQRMGVLTSGNAAAAAAAANKANEEAAAMAAMAMMHGNLMGSPTSGAPAFSGMMPHLSSPSVPSSGMPFMPGQPEMPFTSPVMPAPPASSPTKMSNALLNKAFGFAEANMTNGGGSDGMNANMNSLQRSCTVTLDPLQSTTETLEQACQQKKIRVLCMKSCKGITNLTAISRLQNLWLLNLQGCSHCVDDNAVRMIATHNTRLSRLNLCGCDRVTDARPLGQLSFMFDLNLSGTNINNSSLEAISHGCGQLSRLAINSCVQLTDLSSVKHLSELKLLYCRYSEHIDPATIGAALEGIGQNLLTLNVDGIRFRQLQLDHLPPVVALKNFNCKDNTQLGDLEWMFGTPAAATTFECLEMLDVEGCESLVNLGSYITSLKRLKTMRLTHTGITNEELVRIADCPALSIIHIEECAGVTNVECLARLPSLSKVVMGLSMQHEDPNANGVATLRQRPGVEVIFAGVNNHHGPNGGANRMGTTPTTSPTSRYTPSMPTGSPNVAGEGNMFP